MAEFLKSGVFQVFKVSLKDTQKTLAKKIVVIHINPTGGSRTSPSRRVARADLGCPATSLSPYSRLMCGRRRQKAAAWVSNGGSADDACGSKPFKL